LSPIVIVSRLLVPAVAVAADTVASVVGSLVAGWVGAGSGADAVPLAEVTVGETVGDPHCVRTKLERRPNKKTRRRRWKGFMATGSYSAVSTVGQIGGVEGAW
jgi:hypothetical protein